MLQWMLQSMTDWTAEWVVLGADSRVSGWPSSSASGQTALERQAGQGRKMPDRATLQSPQVCQAKSSSDWTRNWRRFLISCSTALAGRQ